MRIDCLIRGGRVVDPASQRDGIGDVAVLDGRIAAVPDGEAVQAAVEIDARGLLVLPGLIDFHCHIFHGGTEIGVPVDVAMPASGVTTAVDAGSAGVANYRAFAALTAGSVTRTRAFLNVCPVGLATMRYHEDVNPKHFDLAALRRTMDRAGGAILGLKLRLSRGVVGDLGLKPLEAALELAGTLGCRLVVHATDPPAPVADLAARLRPGDVFCHVFHGKGHTIVADGGLDESLPAARARGVVFDAANGGNHFSFRSAETALARGFAPDVISTDLTTKTLFKEPVAGLPYVMAKYLALGVDLARVVRACTRTPAELMGLAGEIGCLAPGAAADVAVLEMRQAETVFADSMGEVRRGSVQLLPRLTMRAGQVVFRSFETIGAASGAQHGRTA